jgi:hypothetical protein
MWSLIAVPLVARPQISIETSKHVLDNMKTMLLCSIILSSTKSVFSFTCHVCLVRYCKYEWTKQIVRSVGMGGYTRAISGQRLDKHVPATTDTKAKIGAVFSMWSVPRCYKQGTSLELSSILCGGGFKYLHRSPASRRKRRKGNPVPGGITGPPCS